MRLRISNTWTQIEEATDEELRAIDECLSFEIPNAKWILARHLEKHLQELMDEEARLAGRPGLEARYDSVRWLRRQCQRLIQKVKRRKKFSHEEAASLFPDCWRCQWDHRIHFLDRRRKAVPTGLLFYISHLTQGAEIVDERRKPGEARPWRTTIRLRDYQEEIVQAAIEAERGIIEVATGGGKTEIAIEIIARLGLRTLIIVPTTPIFNEFKSRWPEYCPDVPLGIIAKGKFEPDWVTLAIFDEGWARDPARGGKLAREVDLIIVDEHHKSAADTWFDYLMTVDAYYRFGQTATASREEGYGETMKLHAVTGPILARKPTRELQDEGYLSEARVEFIPVRCLPVAGSWAEKYRYGIAYNTERNLHIATEALYHQSKGRKVLIIVNWEEHANLLMDEYLGRENCLFLHGGMSAQKAQEIKDEFIATNKILIGTPVVDLGFNVPTIDVLIMAAGGKAHGRQQQRLGRSLRIAPGKPFAQVIDFWDEDDGVLEKHSEERWRTYTALGQQVSMRQV
ncbi:MAG: DEAD/DEAH box helicase [Deltaproteobacteria bacterium]|nr:DEAD/DEAH box helicase [Deltaproteobacteria bacterium]